MNIKDKIHEIRGKQVMLDSDLAYLYEVETKDLNKAVKRNKTRFPENFMFQITVVEYEELNSKIANNTLRFQNGTSSHGGRRYLPYAFTEQGVSMLSAVLRSKKAIDTSIQIINAFV
ncbi:MAG: ORF6N domain-containing protein, partial [Nanoarchaeota archaeon]|nr:ORF6N domain-containing protein [Nanoarchaeota archaeon]